MRYLQRKTYVITFKIGKFLRTRLVRATSRLEAEQEGMALVISNNKTTMPKIVGVRELEW